MGKSHLAAAGASEGILRESAADAKVDALEASEGPSLGHEELLALEVDGERMAARGYEWAAGEERYEGEPLIELEAGLADILFGVVDILAALGLDTLAGLALADTAPF